MKSKNFALMAVSGLFCVLGSGAASAQSEKVEQVGGWKLTIISDPITDESRTIAVASGTGGNLAIKCDTPGANSVYVHFISGEYLGEGRNRNRALTHRFNEEQPVTQDWGYDGRSAILTPDRAVDAFNTNLATASKLALRGTTFEYHQVTAVFELSPADTREALKRVYEGCQDSLPALVAPVDTTS